MFVHLVQATVLLIYHLMRWKKDKRPWPFNRFWAMVLSYNSCIPSFITLYSCHKITSSSGRDTSFTWEKLCWQSLSNFKISVTLSRFILYSEKKNPALKRHDRSFYVMSGSEMNQSIVSELQRTPRPRHNRWSLYVLRIETKKMWLCSIQSLIICQKKIKKKQTKADTLEEKADMIKL